MLWRAFTAARSIHELRDTIPLARLNVKPPGSDAETPNEAPL